MQSSINGKTRLYPIIGDPVIYARSPELLSRSFAERGVNFDLLPDFRCKFAKAWPDLRKIGNCHVRIRQQLECRATLSIFVEGQSVPLGFFRS